MTDEQITNALIKAGVRTLQEFGYEHCTAENIMTDEVYRQFFRSMLKDNLGQGYDAQINTLLERLP